MNEVVNNFGWIWNIVYMICVKGTFNLTVDLKKTLSNWRLLNNVIVGQSYTNVI